MFRQMFGPIDGLPCHAFACIVFLCIIHSPHKSDYYYPTLFVPPREERNLMDWVEQFYRLQNAWSGVYSGDVTAVHMQRVTAIVRLGGAGRKRVLELGAGGGQCAAAAADLGHDVVAVELVADLAANARRLAVQPRTGALEVIQADFYTVELVGPFDVICYWDGFGVGSDADQRRLLLRIAGWLAPSGCALVDVNTPWFWAYAAGREMQHGSATRRYEFDAEGCRMLDHWWPTSDPSQRVVQSLRCYAPADLRLLLEETGLVLAAIEPGGAVDHERGAWIERAPLGQAMQYLAKLVRVVDE
jgi:SAM-dependent methyltransferase